jgi:hypothetical protein
MFRLTWRDKFFSPINTIYSKIAVCELEPNIKMLLFYTNTKLQVLLRPVQVSMPGVHKARRCRSDSGSTRRFRLTKRGRKIRISKLCFRSFLFLWLTLLSLLLFLLRVSSFLHLLLRSEVWLFECCSKSWEDRFQNKLWKRIIRKIKHLAVLPLFICLSNFGDP